MRCFSTQHLQAVVDFTEAHVSIAEQGQPPGSASLPLPSLAACLTMLASEGLSLLPSLGPQVTAEPSQP